MEEWRTLWEAVYPHLSEHRGKAIVTATPKGNNFFYDLYMSKFSTSSTKGLYGIVSVLSKMDNYGGSMRFEEPGKLDKYLEILVCHSKSAYYKHDRFENIKQHASYIVPETYTSPQFIEAGRADNVKVLQIEDIYVHIIIHAMDNRDQLGRVFQFNHLAVNDLFRGYIKFGDDIKAHFPSLFPIYKGFIKGCITAIAHNATVLKCTTPSFLGTFIRGNVFKPLTDVCVHASPDILFIETQHLDKAFTLFNYFNVPVHIVDSGSFTVTKDIIDKIRE